MMRQERLSSWFSRCSSAPAAKLKKLKRRPPPGTAEFRLVVVKATKSSQFLFFVTSENPES
jgi:hypothetical protein